MILSSRDKFVISFRDEFAYINNLYHVPIPFPTNPTIPENSSDASLYDGSDGIPACPSCKSVKLIKDKNNEKETVCSDCGGRFSHKVMDRSWSHYATTPGTLGYGSGSNSNNEQSGEVFHPGQYSNQDSFSGNLGK